MIILLHGDNIEASRAQLSLLKAEASYKEVRLLDGRNTDATGLIQALESPSLFAEKLLIVIENLFKRLTKKPKTIESLVAILRRAAEQTDIVLWEEGELGKTIITSLGGKIKVLFFKTPPVIFQFLDNFRPGNVSILLNLYKQTVSDNPPELVYSLLLRRLRQLIAFNSGIIPPELPGWQANRLTSQTKLFTIEKLVSMYKNLLEIECSIKTGSSPFTLNQHIELWLVNSQNL